MASTEKKIWALLILAEHFFAQADEANGQAYLQEAEAAVDACPKSEDVFEGSARLGYWYLRSERPEQARPHFLKAMDVLPRLKTRDSRRRALAGAFSLLGDAATAAQLEAGIEDPKVQVDILTNKAWQAKNEDRLSEARALLEQALPIARAAKPPRKRLALEHQVITHFRGIGDLDRAEALAMAFEYPGARAKAFVAFAEQSFFDNENRARFLASAKREVGQMPEGKDRQDCQEAVDRLEEPFVASPEEESAFREMFGSE